MATFLDLPVEIRWQIYRYLIGSKCQVLGPTSWLFPWFDRLGGLPTSHSARRYFDDLSITQVSKQMRYEASDILGKSLHYELDIDHPNNDGWLFGIARLFEVTRVAPTSTCTTDIKIKITQAPKPGTMVSYTRTFEPCEFGTGSGIGSETGSGDPGFIRNAWASWARSGDWKEMRKIADGPATGTSRLISGAAFFKTLYGNAPRERGGCYY